MGEHYTTGDVLAFIAEEAREARRATRSGAVLSPEDAAYAAAAQDVHSNWAFNSNSTAYLQALAYVGNDAVRQVAQTGLMALGLMSPPKFVLVVDTPDTKDVRSTSLLVAQDARQLAEGVEQVLGVAGVDLEPWVESPQPVVVDAAGAQVLPFARDPHATVTTWQAHLAADADVRTKSRAHKELAAQLRIVSAALEGAPAAPKVLEENATRNPWADAALVNDYHLGDSTEAAKIVAEHAGHDVLECGSCQGAAYYRATVGSWKCPTCGALLIGGQWK